MSVLLPYLLMMALGLGGFLVMAWITKKPEKSTIRPTSKVTESRGRQFFYGLASHEELLPLGTLGYLLVLNREDYLKVVDARTGTTYYVEQTDARYRLWPIGKGGQIDSTRNSVVSISKAWLKGFYKPDSMDEEERLARQAAGEAVSQSKHEEKK